jgi:hypothetical protein
MGAAVLIGMTTEPKSTSLALAPRARERGKVGYALAWILGVPLPILLVVYLISRC